MGTNGDKCRLLLVDDPALEAQPRHKVAVSVFGPSPPPPPPTAAPPFKGPKCSGGVGVKDCTWAPPCGRGFLVWKWPAGRVLPTPAETVRDLRCAQTWARDLQCPGLAWALHGVQLAHPCARVGAGMGRACKPKLGRGPALSPDRGPLVPKFAGAEWSLVVIGSIMFSTRTSQLSAYADGLPYCGRSWPEGKVTVA